MIEGNKRTKSEALLYYIASKPGTPFEEQTANKDRERLEDLNIFKKVDFDTNRADSNLILKFIVQEKLNIVLIPSINLVTQYLEIIARDPDSNSNQVRYDTTYDYFLVFAPQITLHNFRGRLETLELNLSFGRVQQYRLAWTVPHFSPYQLIYATSFFYLNRPNLFQIPGKRETFLYYNNTFGKNLTRHLRFFYTLSYNQVGVEDSLTLTEGVDRFISQGLAVNHNSLHPLFLPERGLYWVWQISYSGNTQLPRISFFDHVSEIRKYFTYQERHTLALRLQFKQTYGRYPFYRDLAVGNPENIRNHFFEKFPNLTSTYYHSGHNLFGFGNLEYRYSLGQNPQTGIQILDQFRMKFYLTAFVDVGGVWRDEDQFSPPQIKPPDHPTRFLNGAGIGLLAFSPFFYKSGGFYLYYNSKEKYYMSLFIQVDLPF